MQRSAEIGMTGLWPESRPQHRYSVWLLAAASVALISWAVSMYGTQFLYGLGVTGLNKPAFWGLYIVNFIFCVGLSSGGIAVSALVHLAGKEEMMPVAIVAEVMGTSFLLLAGMFIIMDLGAPVRLLYVFRYPNWTSPLLWDVTVISSYLILCGSLLYLSARAELIRHRGNDPRWRLALKVLTLGRTSLSPASIKLDKSLVKTLAIISIPGAVMLHSVTAWILGLVKGQPGWNTPILAPLFIASALVSGLAGVILVVALGRALFDLPIEERVIQSLGRYLLLAIPLLMYLLFSEFLTVGYSGTLSHLEVFREVLLGRFADIFWFDVVVGILIPLILLGLPGAQTVPAISIASLLVVVGVFSERVYLLLPSLIHLRRPGPFSSATAFYAPSVVEWSLMAGAYAFALLIFLAAMGAIFGLRVRKRGIAMAHSLAG